MGTGHNVQFWACVLLLPTLLCSHLSTQLDVYTGYRAVAGDCPGNNIDSVSNVRPEECAAKCTTTPKCVGWVYIVFGEIQSILPPCWLKTKMCNTPVPQSWTTTYFKTEAADGSTCGISAVTPTFGDDYKSEGISGPAPHAWPWMVALHWKGEYICGGTVISKRWILTAAHCWKGGDVSNYDSTAGDHSISNKGIVEQKRKVTRFIRHPDFVKHTNVLALLHLNESLQWTREVNPICLPKEDAAPITECVTTGWKFDNDKFKNLDVLKQVKVPIVDHVACSEDWYDGNITDAMICGQDSCKGDSGGPLMCQEDGVYRLHGVRSQEGDCARPEKPGIYTKVTSMIEWIINMTSTCQEYRLENSNNNETGLFDLGSRIKLTCLPKYQLSPSCTDESVTCDNGKWTGCIGSVCEPVKATVITLVSPRYGPRAGGTLVLIEGLHFNSPDELLVRFNNITCPLVNSSNTQITCVSDSVSSSYVDQDLPVCITRQRTHVTTCYNDTFFTYLPDPTVSRIFPTESLLTGGTNVTVTGTNLMSVAHPALVVTIIYGPTYRASFTSSCEHISNDQLICDTPNITVPDEVKQAILKQSGSQPVRRRRSQTNMLQIQASLQLDAVKDPNAQNVLFNILADPEVTRLTETLVFQPFWPFNDQRFDIKGSGFVTDAALNGTLVVLIGSGQCLDVQRWDNLIACTLSSTRPPNGDDDRKGEYAIQVLIGRRLRFHVGYMEFQQNIFDYPPGRIGLIAGSVFLIVLIVAILLFRRFLPSPKDTPPRTQEILPLQRRPAAETHNAPSSGYENQQSPSGSLHGRNRSARRLLKALNLI